MKKSLLYLLLLVCLNVGSAWAQSTPMVRVGAKVPDFTLVNQDGQNVKLSDFKGKVILMTFLYTQCPDPSKCPMLAQKLSKTRKLVENIEGGKDNFQVISITLDPKRDTPERLKKYSRGIDKEVSNWSFLTGNANDVAKVAALFNVMYFDQKGVIEHNMRTVIIDREGKLARLFTGNDWKVGELSAVIREQLAH